MTYQTLDQIFPYFVFGYGFIMTFILNSNFFMKLAEERLPQQLNVQFKSHRILGAICLVIGGLWSLQNLWYF